MRIKKKHPLVDYHLIQYQILQTKIISNVSQTVRRITKDIMGVKGLTLLLPKISLTIPLTVCKIIHMISIWKIGNWIN